MATIARIQRTLSPMTEMPEGWKFIAGATNHPRGYRWISNGKSLFSAEYRQALLKVDNNL